jgi:hypothetical protein
LVTFLFLPLYKRLKHRYFGYFTNNTVGSDF